MLRLSTPERGRSLSGGPSGSGGPPGSGESGIALIIVTFVVALASILVVNLTYSTYMESRLNSSVERSLQAEYLLKSAVNLARVFIRDDDTPEDSQKDNWAAFRNGLPIPPQLIGISEPNVRVEIEIRPEESKLPIQALVPFSLGTPDLRWRGALTRLFQNLGFDQDNEQDHTGYFPGRVFSSEEMVANLIDYFDPDNDSYDADDFSRGIESDLPDETFPSQRTSGTRLGDLAAVPGFTPARRRKLMPFVTAFGSTRVNLNLAPEVVLRSLHEDITPDLAQQIVAFRDSEEGPFNDQKKLQLSPIIGEDLYEQIAVMIDVRSNWYQVISKVDYGTSTYFMRSYVSKGRARELPSIKSIELF